LKLPSKIKGWFNPEINPEKVLKNYRATNNNEYLSLLVAQFNRDLYHYLLSQSDRATADDILQTTWLKVINVNGQQAEIKHVKSWLFTIARNTLIDELKRQLRWKFVELEPQSSSTLPLDDLIDTEQLLMKYNQFIAELNFYQREAFILQQEGFSLEQIGEISDENYETIKSRLRYARQKLKSVLEQSS